MGRYLVIFLLLVGTAEASNIHPTPVPTSTPQVFPTPVPTATVVPTATPANTPVPTATAVPAVPTATPYLAYDTNQDEGTPTTAWRIWNCIGDLIACASDAGNSRTNITITNPTPLPTATPIPAVATATPAPTATPANTPVPTATIVPTPAITSNTLAKGTFLQDSKITDDGAGAVGIYPAAAVPTPVIQTYGSVVTGTTDTAGAATTIKLSASTGTGVGGTLSIQNTNKAGTGSTVNTYANVFRLSPPNTGTTAPVNYVDLKNAITGSNPTFTAVGTDSNVGINMTPQGTGHVVVTANTFQPNGGLDCNVNSATVCTLQNAFGAAGIIFSNAGTLLLQAAGSAGEIVFGTNTTSGATTRLFRGSDNNGGTNAQAAFMTIAPGKSSGNAASGYVSLMGTAFGASGATLQTRIDRGMFGMDKILTNNTATSVVSATVANNTSIAGIVNYSCEATDGTDVQYEVGSISYGITNKGGALANNVTTKYGNQQAATAGTIAVTWTITAANPALIQVNCNSSLTNSTGYPRVSYELHNLTQQAVAIQ